MKRYFWQRRALSGVDEFHVKLTTTEHVTTIVIPFTDQFKIVYKNNKGWYRGTERCENNSEQRIAGKR